MLARFFSGFLGEFHPSARMLLRLPEHLRGALCILQYLGIADVDGLFLFDLELGEGLPDIFGIPQKHKSVVVAVHFDFIWHGVFLFFSSCINQSIGCLIGLYIIAC